MYICLHVYEFMVIVFGNDFCSSRDFDWVRSSFCLILFWIMIICEIYFTCMRLKFGFG